MSVEGGRAAAAVAVALGVVVLVGQLWDGPIGVPLPPFSAKPDASAGWGALVAAAVLAVAVWAGARAVETMGARARFLVAVTTGALAVRLAVNAARADGTHGWTRTFDLASFEGPLEYLAGRDALAYGRGYFLDRFAELVPSLPVHVAGHPPGLVLLFDLLGIDTAAGLAVLCIGAGVLAAPLTYALARTLQRDERQARLAAVVFALAPGPVLMGATSADALYMTLTLAATVLLLQRPAAAVAAGALTLAVASFLSWALLAGGAFAVCLRLVERRVRDAVAIAVACAVAFVAFHVALHAAFGWDPVGTIRATEGVYRLGIASIRPYAYWVAGSPVAGLCFAGLALVVAWLVAAGRRDRVALALAAIVAVAALAGFSKAETERIWLFMVPWLCVAAVAAIPSGRRATGLVLAALAVQALTVQLLVDTVW